MIMKPKKSTKPQKKNAHTIQIIFAALSNYYNMSINIVSTITIIVAHTVAILKVSYIMYVNSYGFASNVSFLLYKWLLKYSFVA